MADLGQVAAIEVRSDFSNTGAPSLRSNVDNHPGGQVHQGCAVYDIEQPCCEQICMSYQPPARDSLALFSAQPSSFNRGL